jgi:spermidine synthase
MSAASAIASDTMVDDARSVRASQTFLPLLVLLFIGSGCAALIYEIVWFQMLELVIGSSAISLGVLLGTFMGGMCLGSLLAPRLISRNYHPLRVYSAMELGIGIIGLVLLVGMPFIGQLYTTWAGQGAVSMMLRGGVAAMCLLPPTMLMGATLPAISRWVQATPRGVSWIGFFYGGNICGAVIGSLLAGFYLLRVHNVSVATFAAGAINLAVAGLSLLLAGAAAYAPVSVDEEQPTKTHEDSANWAVYLVIALSGMTALACEVLWTRLLSLLFGATVYTFALILAAFLLGLGIGSGLGSALARRLKDPRAALGWCQMALCLSMAWAAYVLMKSLPYWPVDVTLVTSPWLTFQLDIVRCLWAVLPGAIFWGASFPLALAAVASKRQDPGRLVGGLYAANTVGAIVGSIGASLFLVAWIGTQNSQRILIGVSAISALMMLALPRGGAEGGKRRGVAAIVPLVALAGALLVWSVPRLPADLVGYGRFTPTRNNQGAMFEYVGEGLTASVAVSRLPSGTLNYHNAGKIQASSEPADMRLQRMLGHLTTLVPSTPHKFLVIGFGAGVTAGAVSVEPKLDSETIVEIEPLVPKVVSKHFAEHNFNVAANPKVHIIIDDGRHFLLTTKEKFDGITSDPLDPWVKGAAALYTKEFFELAKLHLNPGGVVTQFVQLYESTEEAVQSEIGTFFEVFPHGSVWVNNIGGQGYDLVMLGQAEPTRIEVDELVDRVNSAEYKAVADSLHEIGFASPVDLLATFGGRASDLKPWLANAPINRDHNMRLQYLAGMGLNLYRADEIYRNMVAYGPRMPEDLFSGSGSLLETLAGAIQSGRFR